jgi:Ca2+-transporting ATPase
MMNLEWQNLTVEECARRLNTNTEVGLTARQAERRLREHGANELKPPKKKSLVVRFLAQFCDFMVIILLIAAAISFAVSYWQQDGDYVDSIIILAIVTVNAIIGVIQESRAERAIEALRKMSSPVAHVIRDGKESVIDATKLVAGDLVILKAGDLVPADMRITESYSLQVEESALTGESLPVHKAADTVLPPKTPIGDCRNLLFSATAVTGGRGKGIVTETGMHTQVGRIAGMIGSQTPPQTPLQRKLAQTGKYLGVGALVICFAIFVMGLIQRVPPLDMFLISISLAVAAIPEGLPAVVTITLSVGVRRMAAKRAIVRRMPAVETLGSASVICSDKTGTLTMNRMTVAELRNAQGELAPGSSDAKRLLRLAALCTDCEVDSNGRVRGDPTETAIVRAVSPSDYAQARKKYRRVMEAPFSSTRKRMTTIHRIEGGGYLAVTKGAPDLLFPLCVSGTAPRQNDIMASRALRVIGVAYRKLDALPAKAEDAERDMTFAGLIGMEDPPRPEAAAAVETCKRAGIRPVMITGDYAATAAAIAMKLGIAKSPREVLSGAELDRMSDGELARRIYDYSVFARVSPEHKVRIVRAYQSHGEVVAMTGDGVNDAPALRAADIGCAMGKSGTEVAKSASDMILTDDNFATIVAAVREGRGIYDNIRKTVHFLLSCNIGEILAVFVSFLLRLPLPLAAIQLLWVNLVTDSLPALALGVEPLDRGIMERKPVRRGESIFSGGMAYNIIVEGCLIGALSLLAYSIGRAFFDGDPDSPIVGRTMGFAVLSLSQVVHTFNVRTTRSVFDRRLAPNNKMIPAAILCTLMQAAVIAIRPLGEVFKTSALDLTQWLVVALLSFAPLAVVELEKAVLRIKASHTTSSRKKRTVAE